MKTWSRLQKICNKGQLNLPLGCTSRQCRWVGFIHTIYLFSVRAGAFDADMEDLFALTVAFAADCDGDAEERGSGGTEVTRAGA